MKLNYFAFIVVCIFAYTTNAQPQKWKNKKYLTVVSYNVENLFDTINEPTKNDKEFLPESKKAYSGKRYYNKLNMLSEVISSINSNELPEIIGLTEIENRRVLKDLTNTDALKLANYKIVHEEGPDPRGIDCALIYRPDVFKYLSHESIVVRFPFLNNARTRDILYVKGLIKKDTVHIYVNHWTSRRGGVEKSEPKRVQAASVLKKHVDSILHSNKLSRIIIMGDFNDTPENKSLKEVINAGKHSDSKQFTNLMYQLHDEGKGTYYFRGNYDMIDNLIVSEQLLKTHKGVRVFEPKGWIFSPDFICYTNKNGDKSPNKTYGGSNYYGGYSDHFPIYTILYEK